MINSPIAFLFEYPLNVPSISCTRRDATKRYVSICMRRRSCGRRAGIAPTSRWERRCKKDILPGEGKLAKGAEDASQEGVEGVAIADEDLRVEDLGDEGQQA